MDGNLMTMADARRRLNNSVDGLASVVAFLRANPGCVGDRTAGDAEVYLSQFEAGMRRVKLPGEE